MEEQAKRITLFFNKIIAFQQKLSLYDILPLLKDKRTVASLQFLTTLHPKERAQQLKHKIKILKQNKALFAQIKQLAAQKAKLAEEKKKLKMRLLQAIRNREASASLVDAKRRERNQMNYSIREYKTASIELKKDALQISTKKQVYFELIVKFQKDISHVSIVPSYQQFKAIASATHFLCDVLATSKKGCVPTSIPAIEIAQNFNKFNRNDLIVHFCTSIFNDTREIVGYQAESAQVMAMSSLEKKKKYLDRLGQLTREKREQNKTRFLQNQKHLALVNQKYQMFQLSEGERLLFYSKYYQNLISQKKEELTKMKQKVAQQEAMIWSTMHEQEMLQRLQCIQSMFTLFLKHKKRVDSFVEKKVLPIGEQIKGYSTSGAHTLKLKLELLEQILARKNEVPQIELISDGRFQIADRRGAQIVGNFGWRSYEPVDRVF